MNRTPVKSILCGLVALGLGAPVLAQADEGYVVSDVSLQAGPDTQYPSITDLAAGTPVDVQGCIDGYSWCDVIAGDDRGWIAGDYLQEEYGDQPVLIEDYGPRIGIPIVAFSLGLYWGAHYHNRPWYGQRTQWESRHFHSHSPPRPSVVRNFTHGGNSVHSDHHDDHHGNDHHDDHHDNNHGNDHRSNEHGPTSAASSHVAPHVVDAHPHNMQSNHEVGNQAPKPALRSDNHEHASQHSTPAMQQTPHPVAEQKHAPSPPKPKQDAGHKDDKDHKDKDH